MLEKHYNLGAGIFKVWSLVCSLVFQVWYVSVTVTCPQYRHAFSFLGSVTRPQQLRGTVWQQGLMHSGERTWTRDYLNVAAVGGEEAGKKGLGLHGKQTTAMSINPVTAAVKSIVWQPNLLNKWIPSPFATISNSKAIVKIGLAKVRTWHHWRLY